MRVEQLELYEKIKKEVDELEDDKSGFSDYSSQLDSKLNQPDKSSKSQNEAFENKMLETKMSYN